MAFCYSFHRLVLASTLGRFVSGWHCWDDGRIFHWIRIVPKWLQLNCLHLCSWANGIELIWAPWPDQRNGQRLRNASNEIRHSDVCLYVWVCFCAFFLLQFHSFISTTINIFMFWYLFMYLLVLTMPTFWLSHRLCAHFMHSATVHTINEEILHAFLLMPAFFFWATPCDAMVVSNTITVNESTISNGCDHSTLLDILTFISLIWRHRFSNEMCGICPEDVQSMRRNRNFARKRNKTNKTNATNPHEEMIEFG